MKLKVRLLDIHPTYLEVSYVIAGVEVIKRINKPKTEIGTRREYIRLVKRHAPIAEIEKKIAIGNDARLLEELEDKEIEIKVKRDRVAQTFRYADDQEDFNPEEGNLI